MDFCRTEKEKKHEGGVKPTIDCIGRRSSPTFQDVMLQVFDTFEIPKERAADRRVGLFLKSN